MAKIVQKTLEFDEIIKKLANYTKSSLGKTEIQQMRFLTDYDAINTKQQETNEALKLLMKRSAPPIIGVEDVHAYALFASRGGVLGIGEILRVGDFLRGTAAMKKYIATDELDRDSVYPIIEGEVEALWTHPSLLHRIESTIENEESLYDDASPRLKEIRRSLQNKKNTIRTKLEQILGDEEIRVSLQDDIVTMRQGRYVIPVRNDRRSRVPGLVHDLSSSGQTAFIEPMAVVEINNDIRELEVLEREEIHRILAEISEIIGASPEDFLMSQEIMGRLDFYFAKGKLALEQNAVMPALSREGHTQLVEARHPLIDPTKVVPLSMELGAEYNALIITGPNTGGKTVAIKTLGLLALMAQYGLHIPAKEGTVMGIYERVYADIGDEQSIEQSLSTFSSHMVNIISIMEQATKNSLVLLDELGAGTDPEEGAALALSIINTLKKRGVRVMATTHYNQLKLYALSEEGVENASMEFDLESLSPTYRLIVGVPGKSNAFEISKRLGMPDYLLEGAREFLEEQDIAFEEVLEELENRRQELESLRDVTSQEKRKIEEERILYERENRKLEREKDKILEKARSEAKDLLLKTKEDADLALSEIKDLRRDLEKEQARTIQESQDILRENIKKIQREERPGLTLEKVDKPLESLKPGQTVFAQSLGLEATVLEYNPEREEALVQAGIMKMTLPLDTLLLREEKKQKRERRGGSKDVIRDKTKAAKAEVDIRGKTFEEALPIIDKAIDDAYLVNLKQLRIIHGKGTGALGRKIKDYLRTHTLIKGQKEADPEEGGSGVTYAILK